MRIEKAICYSFHLRSEEALGYLRLIGPLRHAGISIINGIEDDQVLAGKISEGEIVIFQRDFPILIDEFRKVLDTAREEGKAVVFDLDDLLFCLPKNHPAAQHYASSLLPMFRAMTEVDLISVSTPKLRDVLGEYNDHIVVLPNFLDDALWQFRPPVFKKFKNEPLTIGYMGGLSHKADLEYIAPVIRDLIYRYPRKVNFHFWGIEPPEEVSSLDQVSYTRNYHPSYKDFASFFQNQSADIFLAPLEDNLFNRCKSPIKFFEYSALGAPGVFSNLETYQEVVIHGKNGLTASTLEDWSTCLVQLIENDELRFQLANNAQATIRESWLLSKNSMRWQDTYAKLIDFPSHPELRSQDDLLHSVITQSVEIFKEKEIEIQKLKLQLADREVAIQEVVEKKNQAEAVNARLLASKSWRITYPLRKIIEKLRRMK